MDPKAGQDIGRAPKAVRASGPPHGDTRTWGQVDTRGMGTWGHAGGTPRDVTPLALEGKTLHGGMGSHWHVDRNLGKARSSMDTPDMAPYRLSYTQATTRPLPPLL